MNISVEHPTDRPNFYAIWLDEVTVWFSYRTPIAFKVLGGDLVIRENDWSNTTGGHLNFVSSDKSGRIPGDAFEAAFKSISVKVA